MIRDITIGQYYPTDSVIHRLDPRTKLVWTLAYIFSLFLFRSFASYAVATILLITVIKISKVPFKFMVKGMKAVVILLLITVVFNLFLIPGTTLVQIWKLRITYEGLNTAVFMALRLTYLIIGSSVMTLTTTPNQLTDGMEKGLAPLNRLHVPVHDVAMMMSIALRFIPILLEETDKIMKAQLSRGADFENGNIFKRIRSYTQIFIPLFASAIRRATDLAYAMDARCYHGSECRTSMKPLRYSKKDAFAYGLLVVYVVGLILMKIYL